MVNVFMVIATVGVAVAILFGLSKVFPSAFGQYSNVLNSVWVIAIILIVLGISGFVIRKVSKKEPSPMVHV